MSTPIPDSVHRFGAALRCLAGALAIACAIASSSVAAKSLGTLQVVPPVIELCADRAGLVRVTATEASAARLSWNGIGNAAVTELSLPGDSHRAAPRTWLLRLEWPQGELVPGVIHLFARPKGDRAAPVSAGTLEIKALQPEAPASSVKLELQMPWDAVDDRQQLPFWLVVSNTSAATARISHIDWANSPFTVTAVAGAASTPFSIEPGGVAILPYRIGLDLTAREPSGKKRLLVRVDAESRQAGCQRKMQSVASHDFGFNVFGESAVLAAAGIPAFLLVPGFLMVMAPLLLWQLGLRPGLIGDRQEFWFPPLKPEFWTLAVSLSLLVWMIGSHFRPDLFVAYRLEQVATVWALSLAASGVPYVVYVLVTRWLERRKTYTIRDGALALLGKMARRGAAMQLPRAEVDLAAAEQGTGKHPALILDRVGDSAWVVPGIRYGWKVQPIPNDLETKLDAALKEGSAASVYRILKAADGRQLTVRWSAETDEIGRPYLVPFKAIGGEAGKVQLVGND